MSERKKVKKMSFVRNFIFTDVGFEISYATNFRLDFSCFFSQDLQNVIVWKMLEIHKF